MSEAAPYFSDADSPESSLSSNEVAEIPISSDSEEVRKKHKKNGFWHNFWHVVLQLHIAFLIGVSFRLVLLPEVLLTDASKREKTDYLLYFGVSKAVSDLVGGILADGYGRKETGILGWGIGLLIIPVLLWTEGRETEGSDVRMALNVADVLLGTMQGLTWGVNVICLMDILGPQGRGFACALSDAFGYLGSVVTAPMVGSLVGHPRKRAHCTLALMMAMFLGMFLSLASEKSTKWLGFRINLGACDSPRVAHGAIARQSSLPMVAKTSSLRSAARASCSFGAFQILCSVGGMTVNAAIALVWGPALVWLEDPGHADMGGRAFAEGYFTSIRVAAMLASSCLAYILRPQPLVAVALFVQTIGLFALLVQVHLSATSLAAFLVVAAFIGVGTGAAYPLLAASVTYGSPDETRASVYGAYRMWRDIGYTIGGIIAHVFAGAFLTTTAIMCLWSLVVAVLFAGFLGLSARGQSGAASLPSSSEEEY